MSVFDKSKPFGKVQNSHYTKEGAFVFDAFPTFLLRPFRMDYIGKRAETLAAQAGLNKAGLSSASFARTKPSFW
jgi:hypothetical protein